MNDDARAAEADQARATFAGIKERVSNDKMLSEDGKREKIEAARDTTNRKIEALRQESVAARDAEGKRLEKLLFSPPPILSGAATPADRIARDSSYRDALDRARRTDPQKPGELLELHRQAERTSDTLQARAAMVIAFERNNGAVLDAWDDANPAYHKELQRLYDLTAPNPRALRDRVAESFKWAKV